MAAKKNFNPVIDPEIDIKDENPLPHTESALKSDASDYSDVEVLAVCKSTALHRNKLLKPIYSRRRAKTSVKVNNDTANNSKLLFKEEIVISDGSDVDDNDKCNMKNITSNGCVAGHINPKEKKLEQDESLSAIILNCPRCNITRKVFSITIISNCKECNVSMHYVCNKCNYKYDSMPALYRHKKLQCQFLTSKQKKKPSLTSMVIMKCRNCDQVKKMLFTQRNPPRCSPCRQRMCYECIVCSKPYTSYSGIYTHVRRYCQSRRRTFYCNDCAFSCTKPSTLVRHMKLSHVKYFLQRDILCLKCGQTFENSEVLKRHESLCGIPQYQCKFCSYRPKVGANLEKHLLTRHAEMVKAEGLDDIIASVAENSQIKDDAFVVIANKGGDLKIIDSKHIKKLHCPKCNRTDDYIVNLCTCFTCKTSYLYQCDPCHKRFITSASLHRHVRRCHTEHKFNCDRCGKGFACVGDMNVHKKICGQELRYECSVCQFKTRYKGSLSSHMYKLHNDNRRAFQCGTCGVVYKTNRAMKRHVKIGCCSID